MSTITVSLPDYLRAHAERLAREEGISVNQLVTSAMGEKLAALEGLSRLEDRAARGRMVDIDRILAKVPSAEPLPGDELPR